MKTKPIINAQNTDNAVDPGFAQRIQALIAKYGGVTHIARMCGFSEGVVRSWRDGRSDPSRQRCVTLAGALGISLVWLVAGDGGMQQQMHTDGSPGPDTTADVVDDVDTHRLTRAMKVLQSILDSTDNELPVESQAELLSEYYTVLGHSDPIVRAEGISEVHRHLVQRMRKAKALA